jgi:hypothetical protein
MGGEFGTQRRGVRTWFWWGKLKKRGDCEDLDIDGKILK